MVVLKTGKDRIKDLVVADMDSATHGTDGTKPTSTDLDLGAKDATTTDLVTTTSATQTFNARHIMLSPIGNGTTYKEVAFYMNGGNTPLSRVVYPDFQKTSTIELHTISTFRVE